MRGPCSRRRTTRSRVASRSSAEPPTDPGDLAGLWRHHSAAAVESFLASMHDALDLNARQTLGSRAGLHPAGGEATPRWRASLDGDCSKARRSASVPRRSARRRGAANLALPRGLVPTVRPRTPVDHTVVLMLENRSVDHYLGWYGAEQPDFDASFDQTWPGPDGAPLRTKHWAPDYSGCGFRGSWPRLAARPGGSTRPGSWPRAPTTTSTRSATTSPTTSPCGPSSSASSPTFDRYFCSVLGPTQPNRYYLHSAQSHGLKDNSLPPELAMEHPEWRLGWDWPTIWTLLERAGVTWAYYYCNLPEVLFWGAAPPEERAPHLQLLRGRRGGTAAAGRVRRPVVHRARGDRERRSPARRHPTRSGAPRRRRRRVRRLAQLPATARCSSPTTSGAASSTTSSRRA